MNPQRLQDFSGHGEVTSDLLQCNFQLVSCNRVLPTVNRSLSTAHLREERLVVSKKCLVHNSREALAHVSDRSQHDAVARGILPLAHELPSKHLVPLDAHEHDVEFRARFRRVCLESDIELALHLRTHVLDNTACPDHLSLADGVESIHRQVDFSCSLTNFANNRRPVKDRSALTPPAFLGKLLRQVYLQFANGQKHCRQIDLSPAMLQRL
mmetsp:Transcript_140639/g.449592  ORF Transcript_140639/g.449592 Transcript_140639/m.449592 type:complete len:211 (-) Transcript_140639:4199-4831(-)